MIINKEWHPTNYQRDRTISETKKYIEQRLDDLHNELGCPNEFIYDFIKDIQHDWDPDSCKSKAEDLQKNQPLGKN